MLLIGTLCLLGVIIILSIPISILYVLGSLPQTFYWGIPVGILMGSISYIYIMKIWDPAILQFKKTKSKKTNEKWQYLLVFTTIFIGRMTLEFLSREIGIFIITILLVGFMTTLTYMLFSAWVHRPH